MPPADQPFHQPDGRPVAPDPVGPVGAADLAGGASGFGGAGCRGTSGPRVPADVSPDRANSEASRPLAWTSRLTGRPCAPAKGLQHLVQLRQHLLTRLDGAGAHELAGPIHHALQVATFYHLRGRHLGHALEPFALQMFDKARVYSSMAFCNWSINRSNSRLVTLSLSERLHNAALRVFQSPIGYGELSVLNAKRGIPQELLNGANGFRAFIVEQTRARNHQGQEHDRILIEVCRSLSNLLDVAHYFQDRLAFRPFNFLRAAMMARATG